MKKFILSNVGLGDITVFISYFYQILHNEERILIDFDKNVIERYLDDPEGYFSFLEKLVRFLSPDDKIVIQKNLDGESFAVDQVYHYYRDHSIDFKYINVRNKFPSDIDYSAVVLNTKIRTLENHLFQNIKNDVFKILNNSSKKIILIGERELIYGKLYNPNDKNIVYSGYTDYIQNINPSKLIDLSMPSYGRGSLNFDHLMDDMKIIAKHKNVCFGTSGATSITSCIADIISYSSYNPLSIFIDKKQEIIKTNRNKFLNDLEEYLK
jgi:hypothetical protein